MKIKTNENKIQTSPWRVSITTPSIRHLLHYTMQTSTL